MRVTAAQERVGHLDEDAGAVAGVDLGAGRAAMVEAAERAEGGVDDVAALRAGDVDDEADAAGIVLEARVVEAVRLRQRAERQEGAIRADGRQRARIADNAGAAVVPFPVGPLQR